MALEVTSSTVSSLQKVAKPVDTAPEQRAAAKTADITGAATSVQNERQVVAHTEQNTTNLNNKGTGEQGAGLQAAPKEENDQNQDTTAKRIQSAVKRANNKMRMTKTSCEFVYHEETNRVSIKVMDDETHEVIREIPSEEALELVQKMWEMAGMMVDERR